MQQLCKSGNAAVCKGLTDPPTLLLLKQCSTGDNAACNQLHLPGGNQTSGRAPARRSPTGCRRSRPARLKVRLPKPGEAPFSTCMDHVVVGSLGRQVLQRRPGGHELVEPRHQLLHVLRRDRSASTRASSATRRSPPTPIRSTRSPVTGTFHLQGSARGADDASSRGRVCRLHGDRGSRHLRGRYRREHSVRRPAQGSGAGGHLLRRFRGCRRRPGPAAWGQQQLRRRRDARGPGSEPLADHLHHADQRRRHQAASDRLLGGQLGGHQQERPSRHRRDLRPRLRRRKRRHHRRRRHEPRYAVGRRPHFRAGDPA